MHEFRLSLQALLLLLLAGMAMAGPPDAQPLPIHRLPLDGASLGDGRALQARYADISEFVERKVAGLRVYASQIEQLFQSDQGMLDDVAGYARRVALAGGVGSGAAERYWGVVRP